MAKFTKSQMSFIKLVAFVGISLAAYEVFYNFAIWTAEIATNSLLGVLNPRRTTESISKSKNTVEPRIRNQDSAQQS